MTKEQRSEPPIWRLELVHILEKGGQAVQILLDRIDAVPGDFLSRLIRYTVETISKARPLLTLPSSSQRSGIATGAPSCGHRKGCDAVRSAAIAQPRGHADYDERLLRVLQYMAIGRADIDIRQVLVQARERAAQHSSSRSTPDELRETLTVDPLQCGQPFKRIVFVVDDVITMGASFAAAKQLLTGLPSIADVRGLFLAKTVWPNPFAAVVLPQPFEPH
ncbi:MULTISPECIES: hypothetical protein [Lysobacter]|uniref:hypothetical protein n=1 Tax=Lysobacter TaxID=68 RepID=UPI001F189A45|nr:MULTISPECIES: hypothetical protein [Lysobacter]UJB19585.1 hypothetical protein L1A79_00345 [Lysobacter capsici]UJQ26689.1 hypothetical protein L2D09_14515 [Lysobacter gummosus]